MEWLKSIAPSLATAIAGPLGGLAASFIADKLGVDEKTVAAVSDALEGGKMDANQVTQIKLAEIEFKKFLEANEIKLEDIAAQDRKSAREMQIATSSWVPAVLSIGVTIGFFSILSWMLTAEYKPSDPLLVMLGSLGTAWTAIVAYWFGSSSGSDKKTDILMRK